jgi:NADPH-dependent curcumin reductase CurA
VAQPFLAVRAQSKTNVPETNRQLKLQSRPQGLLAPSDLQLAEASVPSRTGQTLARVKYLSMDPTMRVWMAIEEVL